ncbi:chemotaxis response regulator protein-glutamate methylesterase [Thermogutta sp.]|jgi:two-component system chemotaxis response regulator CheB|uniref:protein-glutamate methylesterase/protein-glutamine glutaminase n=1 Tax=Thermogutta sp. TaxID=1962930 RepID=UPI00322040C8
MLSKPRIKVLVVDDSLVMRQLISDVLSSASDMEVVGMAPDGRSGLRLADELQPDVVTLDIQMPGMDGLSVLDALVSKRPVAVIMVSSLTQAGAAITLDALERGAVDYVTKPSSAAAVGKSFGIELVRKVRFAAACDVARIIRLRRQRLQATAIVPSAVKPLAAKDDSDCPQLRDACVAIGISTGGPPALTALFRELKPPMPPIFVVQHMPPQFTKPFAWRLNSVSALTVKEAESGEVVRPNHAYVAPGGSHMAVSGRPPVVRIRVFDGEPVSGHKPSVDVMMNSVAEVYGKRVLGVIMTGMGRDGADGCRAIRRAGGYVLGQDEATSDVYGMNKVAFVEGNVDRQFSLPDGARLITQYVEEHFLSRTAGVR